MKSFYRRFTSFVMSVVVLGMALASNAVPVQAATSIQVDDDHAQCPHAAYTDLQLAINAMGGNPGKITVCAGTYYGPFTVLGAQDLKLIARKGAVIRPGSLPFNGSLFDVISSSNVTVQGFVFDGMGNVGSSVGNSALQYSESSGKILKNTIQNWHTLNYASAAYQIYSIYLTSGNTQQFTISGNKIVEYQGRAMQIEGRSVVKLSGNKFYAGTNTNNTGIAIYTFPIGSGFPAGTIKGNKIYGAYTGGGTAITSGILLFETSGMTVSNNTLSNLVSGIHVYSGCKYLAHADNNTIKGNKLSGVLTGIEVESAGVNCDSYADGNKVLNNKIKNTTKGAGGIVFSASSTSYHGYAQNELAKGNKIDNFNIDLFLSEGANGTLTGVFTPNKLYNDGP